MSGASQGKLKNKIQFVRHGTYCMNTQSNKLMKRNNDASIAYSRIVSNKAFEFIDLSDDDDVMIVTNDDIVALEDDDVVPIRNITLNNKSKSKKPKFNSSVIDLLDTDVIVEDIDDISIVSESTNKTKDHSVKQGECIIEAVKKSKSGFKKRVDGSYFEKRESNLKELPNFPNIQKSDYDWCDVCCVSFTRSSGHELTNLHKMKEMEVISGISKVGEGNQEYSIPCHNIGFKMLLAAGWKKNTGLGRQNDGMKAPIKTVVQVGRTGLGMKPKFNISEYHKAPSQSKYSNFVSKNDFIRRSKLIERKNKDKKLERDIRRELSSDADSYKNVFHSY